jgi:pyrroloquinoline quinone (PQQ) biosynthesis protein C
MRWFLGQEAAGEAGFDDLVAMTQVKMPALPKLELARNYWDEMGRGNPKGMHGPMLDVLIETLGDQAEIDTTVWESLALANAMTAMATTRRYAWHSVGALGAIELTAPGRSAATAQGLRRLGFSERERRYFSLHAVLDVKHSEDWNREALRPLVEEDPRRATAIAEGALIRLQARRALLRALSNTGTARGASRLCSIRRGSGNASGPSSTRCETCSGNSSA